MSSEKRLNHIIQKYPGLMLSLSSNLTKRHTKTAASKIEKLLKRSVERRTRCINKKLPMKKFRQFGNELLASIASEVFSCPVCVRTLTVPVTLSCGHTFCRGCLLEKASMSSCAECGRTESETIFKCNVLVQSVIEKLVGDDNGLSKYCGTINNPALQSYQLRCPNNLSSRQDDSKKDLKLAECAKESNVCPLKLMEQPLTKDVIGADLTASLASDLECVLCGRCLHEPVTTNCGHTFCRECVARVLDYGLACPLCMHPLGPTGAEHSRAVTAVLDTAIRRLLPAEYGRRARAHDREINGEETDSKQVPVFVCTSAFPGVACPLYVYEPRYRLLTRRCLQTNTRRFAMAASGAGLGTNERFASYGTLLEVRDAVHLQDGRTILTTVGQSRFKVIDRGEKDGYDTATVEYIRDYPVPPHQLPTLRALHERVHRKASKWVQSLAPHVQAEIEQSLGLMPAVEPNWPSLPDGPAWAWWLMPILPLSSQLQVGFLSTLSMEKRLRAIDKTLERMSVRMQALDRSEVSCMAEEPIDESCRFSERNVGISVEASG